MTPYSNYHKKADYKKRSGNYYSQESGFNGFSY